MFSVLSMTKGCNGLVLQNENKFMCPCHGSQYNFQGKVVRGPAPLVSVHYIHNLIICIAFFSRYIRALAWYLMSARWQFLLAATAYLLAVHCAGRLKWACTLGSLTPDMGLCAQSLALAHTEVVDDVVFLTEW
jgi:hypothetical protein